MFKIAKLEKIFKQKLITDSVILNKWFSFSGIVDKWRGSLEDCIISLKKSVNKSQLEMNVEKKVVNIQPIYEPLKKQKQKKTKKIWKDNQDGEQQGKQRRWVDIPSRMKINIKFIYLILEIKDLFGTCV